MNFLSYFLPIIIFFVIYKFAGIYIATASAILTNLIQIILEKIQQKKVASMQWLSFAIIILLGGSTILFHNDIFIKWKPTVLDTLLALVFLISHFTKKTVLERLMAASINLPSSVWRKLNMSWIFFFLIVASVNLFVAYHYNTNTWVNFKLFGILGLTLIFVVIQTWYLSRHLNSHHESNRTNTKAD